MKRKLINYEVFESMQNNSLSAVEQELNDAAPILSRVLSAESLTLQSFGTESALFEDVDGKFIRSNYVIKDGYVNFDNIEQIVIDDESEKAKARDTIALMMEALLENKEEVASQHFSSYLSLPYIRRTLKESIMPKAAASTGRGKKSKFRGKSRAGGKAAARKAARTREKTDRLMTPAMEEKIEAAREKAEKKIGGKPFQTTRGKRSVRTYVRRVGVKKMHEWANLCNNVFEFADYKEFGPTLHEANIGQDSNGNIVAVRIPTTNLRNEGKLLSFNWKTLATDVKVLRNAAKKLTEDVDFCKAVFGLKRQNALSDNAALEESLENIVSQYPGVLYLTQDELANTIKVALETVNATNYDDQTCAFMAEGILRTAHTTFADRVEKITALAGAKVNESSKDKYADFKTVADTYFVSLDEAVASEMQAYVDLYEALRGVYELAIANNDEEVVIETASHLDGLLAIIQGKSEPTVETAEDAAAWLASLVETNLETGDWNVSNTPHMTISGDHPEMEKKAKTGYTPASDFSGKCGPNCTSDGKTIKDGDEAGSFWTNQGGETYPELKNPYIPAPFGDYTMKGEKGVDKEDGIGFEGGNETWPALQNPYAPKAETPQSYKMKNGPDTDLVVDK